MPKKAIGLAARQVIATTVPGLHAAGGVPELYLQVTAGSGRSWVYRYQLGGKRCDMGLGPLDAVTLAEARQCAHKVRKLVLEGEGPIEARRLRRMALARDAAKAMSAGNALKPISPRIGPAGAIRCT